MVERMPKAESKTQGLNGKKVFIVGNAFYTDVHKEDMENAGATVVYPANREGSDGLTEYQVNTVKEQILAENPRPDVVMIYHPRMDMYEHAGGGFEWNPAVVLARSLKKEGIPTLIVDSYGLELDKKKEQALRDAGATFRPMLRVHYDEITTLLGYMANNKAKLTGFGITS